MKDATGSPEVTDTQLGFPPFFPVEVAAEKDFVVTVGSGFGSSSGGAKEKGRRRRFGGGLRGEGGGGGGGGGSERAARNTCDQ